MSDIVKLADRQKPVSYTIDVTHHYSGDVEIFVRDVSDDSRSIAAVIAFVIKWASQHMKARDIHVSMLERIDQLMDAQKDTPEAKELSALASACEAYEREAFPNVLTQDSVAEQAVLQGQYDVYATAREEYRKKISEQAARIEQLEAALADNKLYVETWSDDYDAAMAVLKDAYTVLAFAFQRIHSLPRSRDTELATDIGKCRAKIEKIIARAALGEKP